LFKRIAALVVLIWFCCCFAPRAAAEPAKLWERRITSDVNGASKLYAVDVTADAAENIYVAGYSLAGTDKDMVTAKYDCRGNLQWHKVYDYKPGFPDIPNDIAVDGAGNVYVAGKSYYKHSLVKYDSAGNKLLDVVYTQFTADQTTYDTVMQLYGNHIYMGINDSQDRCRVLKVDAGSLSITAQVAPADTRFRDLCVAGGKVFVLVDDTANGNSFLVYVYDSSLNLLDSARYPPGGGSVTRLGSFIISPDGSAVYAAGLVGATTARDIEIVKYTFDGSSLSAPQSVTLDEVNLGLAESTAANYALEPVAAAFDAGRLVVAGNCAPPSGDKSFLLFQLSDALELQWSETYLDEAWSGGSNGLKGMALDDAGRIYLTGVMGGSDNARIHTMQYDAAGNRQWMLTYANPVDGYNVAKPAGIAVSGAGDAVYVAGHANGENDFDLLAFKYGYVTWESYRDQDHTSPADSFASPDHVVYMQGEGFFQAGNYLVAYYDGNGDKVHTESVPAAEGVLASQYDLQKGGQSGTWHAVVFQPGASPPTTYAAAADDHYRITGDDFTVAESAIPEFPALGAGLGVAAACAAIYLWMRRRVAARA